MGKRTTTRHKADNTFKFESFAEKLSRIHTNIAADFRGDLSLGRLNPDDDKPNLLRCFEKWTELNLTESSSEILEKIAGAIQTLPQILHRKEFLVDSILSHISVNHEESLEVTFELVVSLLYDIGNEFDAYRDKFISQTVNIIHKLMKVETIESGFKCLAYLVKSINVSRCDINEVVNMFKTLLQPTSPVYHTVLAAECLHKMLYRVWCKEGDDDFSARLIKMMRHDSIGVTGVETIFYCMLRGVNGTLRLNGTVLLKSLLRRYLTGVSKALWSEVTRNLIEKLILGLDKDANIKIIDCIFDTAQNVSDILELSEVYALLEVCLKHVSKQLIREIKVGVKLDALKVIPYSFGNTSAHHQSIVSVLLACICCKESEYPVKTVKCFLRSPDIGEDAKKRFLEQVSDFSGYLELIVKPSLPIPNEGIRPEFLVANLLLRKLKQPYIEKGVATSFSLGNLPSAICRIRKTRMTDWVIPEGILSEQPFEVCSWKDSKESNEAFLKLFCMGRINSSQKSTPAVELEKHAILQEVKTQQVIFSRGSMESLLVVTDRLYHIHQRGQMVDVNVIQESIESAVEKLHYSQEIMKTDPSYKLLFLKALDFLTGVIIFSKPTCIDIAEILEYVTSGFMTVRSVALSILYNICLDEEQRLLALKTCLEVEALNFRNASVISEINMRMEKLVVISREQDPNLNKLLVSFGLGTLFRDYSPLQAKAAELIKNCWLNQSELGYYILSQLENHCEGLTIPSYIDHLKKIQNSDVFYEKYEYALFGHDDKPYEILNTEKYCRTLWEIIADVVASSTLAKDLLERCLALADKTMKEYRSSNGQAKYKEEEINGKQFAYTAKYLVPVVKVVGKCIKQGVINLDPYLSYFQYFLMSTSPQLQKAALDAFYDALPVLSKYREEIETMLFGKIPDLTSFSVEAIEPVIKEDKDRFAVMQAVLPICSRLYLNSKVKKKKGSKSKKPIVLGVMGFSYAEVSYFLDFVLGDPNGFKSLTMSNIMNRLMSLYDLIWHWENKYAEIAEHMLQLTLQLVEASHSLPASTVDFQTCPASFADMDVDTKTPEHGNVELEASNGTMICGMEISRDNGVMDTFGGSNEDVDTLVEINGGVDELLQDGRVNLVSVDAYTEPTNPREVSDRQFLSASAQRCVLAVSLKIVMFVFEKFPKCWTNCEMLHRVMDLVVMPRLEKAIESSTGSVSTIISLLELWSRIPRYRVLLLSTTKNHRGNEKVPMCYVAELLRSKSVHHKVKIYLLKLFLNVVDYPSDETENMEETIDLGIGEPNSLLMTKVPFPEKSIDTNILMYDAGLVLRLVEFLDFSQLTRTPKVLEGYLKILKVVVHHSSTEVLRNNFNNSISNLSVKSEVRVAFLYMMKEVILKMCHAPNIIIGMSKWLRIIEDREQRMVLLETFEGFDDVDCKDILRDLNSYDIKDLTAPDYQRRSQGWVKLTTMLAPGLDFELQRFCLIGNQMMHILTTPNQAAENRNALNALTALAKLISNPNQLASDPKVQAFFDTVLMSPTLKKVVLNTRLVDSFENRLRVMRIFALYCPYDNILKGLKVLVHHQEDQDIICGLVDIKVNNRTKAMNRLVKLLEIQLSGKQEEKPFINFGQNLLLNYLLPIATYFLMSKNDQKSTKQESVLDNLLQSSVEMYKVAAMLLTPQQYFSFLDELLSQKPTEVSKMKRYKRQVLAVMNGFRYNFRDPDETEKSFTGNLNSFFPVLQKLRSLLSYDTASRLTEDHNLDQILTVECTVGLVKLLKRFPETIGREILSPMIPNICSWLKSKSTPQRRRARETLTSFLRESGVESFPRILSSLQANLKVGYQKHVLTNVVFSLLSSCESLFANSAVPLPVKSLLPICEDEFFGVMYEEKSVGKIVEKTREARKPNAENIITLAAKLLVRSEDLQEMIKVGLNHLRYKVTEKNVSQVRKWFSSIVNGITNNQRFPAEDVLNSLTDLRKYMKYGEPLETSIIPAKESTKGRSTMEFKKVLPPIVKNSNATEVNFFLNIELKVLYNYNQQGRPIPLDMYLSYFPHCIYSLSHSWLEIMRLAHRLVSNYLRIDELRDMLPAALPSIPDVRENMWHKIMLNVTKFCGNSTDDPGAYETINIIFTTVVAFLKAYPDSTLKQSDFSILMASFQHFINNEHCFSPVLQILSGIINMKVEEKLISDVMKDVLKTSVRSTSVHVIEGCRKLYLQYVMNYLGAKRDGLSEFMFALWEQAKGAEQTHEKLSILTTLEKLIRGAKMTSVYKTFHQKLPIISLECLNSDVPELQKIGLLFLDSVTSSKEYANLVCKYGQSMLNKKPYVYDSAGILYLSSIFKALVRDFHNKPHYPIVSVFFDSFTNFMFQLVQKDEEEDDAMNAGFAQILNILTSYVKLTGSWSTNGFLELKWDELIRFVALKRLDYYLPIVKLNTVEIVSCLLQHCNWAVLVSTLRNEPSVKKSQLSPLSFLRTMDDLKALIEMHFQAIKLSKVLLTKQKAAQNLIFLVQLAAQSQDNEDYGHIFVKNVKIMMNEEVVKNPESTKMREIGYGILIAYVNFLDVEIHQEIIYRGYQTRTHLVPLNYHSVNNLQNVRTIVRLAIRDSTDNNTSEDLRKLADGVCGSISTRFGQDLYNEIDTSVRSALHDKRRENKSKKAENAVLNPGKKRKRTTKPLTVALKKRKSS